MNFEKFSEPPTNPEEIQELLGHYSLEEKELILEQIQSDLYSCIKDMIIKGKANSLKEKMKLFFIKNLKEEDFELASKLNS